jgi:Flp pilus assembly protein TadG
VGGAGAARREGRDRGTAIVGTLVGFTIFILLLLVAVQTLVHLYASSTVSAATFDAAWAVATEPNDEAAEIPIAETQARRRMGRLGSSATFRWLEADGQQVAVEVEVRSPGFLPFSSSLLQVQRTVVVRTERFR